MAHWRNSWIVELPAWLKEKVNKTKVPWVSPDEAEMAPTRVSLEPGAIAGGSRAPKLHAPPRTEDENVHLTAPVRLAGVLPTS